MTDATGGDIEKSGENYVEAVDALSMAPVEKLEGTCMLAMAVYIGKTRLIDNTLINE